MNKLNILLLFTIPLNTCRHDTPTVHIQVLRKSELSGKFFCSVALLSAMAAKLSSANRWLCLAQCLVTGQPHRFTCRTAATMYVIQTKQTNKQHLY